MSNFAERVERARAEMRGAIETINNWSLTPPAEKDQQSPVRSNSTVEDIAETVASAVVDAIGNDEQATITVNVTEDAPVNSGLVIPITFDGSLNDDGSVVGEEPLPDQPVMAIDPSNPAFGMMQAMQQPVMPNQAAPVQQYVDNSLIINRYPQLKNHERIIRELGFDCMISINSYGLIDVTVIKNNAIDRGTSYTVDMEGIVLGPEAKWLNTYQPKNNSYENYACIPLGKTELLKKYLNGNAGIDEIKEAMIYDDKYLSVNDIVDLRTLPRQLEDGVKEKIIDRLYKAIDSKIFDEPKDVMGKFVIRNFINVVNFSLVKGMTTIHFTKDKANVVSVSQPVQQ